MKQFFTIGGKVVGFFRSNNARQLTVFHPRRLPRLLRQALFVEIGGGKTRAHRAFVADVTHECSCIDAFDGNDVPAFQIRLEALFGAPVGSDTTRFTNDKSFDPRARRLCIAFVDAVVADERVGHAHDLSRVRGIGKHLLITGHRGIENHLAADFAFGRPGATAKRATIFKSQEGWDSFVHFIFLRLFVAIASSL